MEGHNSLYSFNIAKKMKQAAMEINDKNTVFIEDMFMLGLMHNTGKYFSSNNKNSSKILKRNGYKYWKEIHYQLCFDTDYESLALTLLNTAIILTDNDGKTITAYDKLNSILKKYGKNSKEYVNIKNLALKLKLVQDVFVLEQEDIFFLEQKEKNYEI